MTVCLDCNKDMLDPKAESCTLKQLFINGQLLDRNTTHYDKNKRCHDCGILNKPGNVHHYNCDMENCPSCGGQLISCSCDVADAPISRK